MASGGDKGAVVAGAVEGGAVEGEDGAEGAAGGGTDEAVEGGAQPGAPRTAQTISAIAATPRAHARRRAPGPWEEAMVRASAAPPARRLHAAGT